MKKSLFSFVSLLLILTVAVSSLAMFPIAADEIETNYEWSQETPFIMYEDEEGVHYIGPTGDTTLVNTEEDEPEENTRHNGELASLAESSFPSQIDLSTSKHFPAIGNQGSLGSCATWATVYYQFTYEMNRARGTTATPENTAAPNFVYNLLAEKDASGTSAEGNYAILKSQGVPPITMVPYDDKNHLSWNADGKIWREAMNWRLEDYKDLVYIGKEGKEVTSPTDSDLDEIKTALNNGQVVTFSSFMNSWVYGNLKTHPDAPENAKYEGERIVKYVNGTKGSHRMVIVGYNDGIWFDHNSNGNVDAGEMGAFKIANSWGTTYSNKGFCWVSYDVINEKTSVEGGYAGTGRVIGMGGYTTITVRPYKEGSGIYLKFTLNTADRSQCFVKVETERNGTTEKGSFLSGINYSLKTDNKFSYLGNTVAEDGTVCFPLDNVSPELTPETFNEYAFSVTVQDSKADSKPLIVKNLEIVNEHTGKTYKPSVSIPTLDGKEFTVDMKSHETNNKVIYYIGYDEPTVHYLENGTWKEAEMEKNEEHLGHNYKYVIKELPGEVKVYFTDKNGNKDDNSGNYFIAKERLNYFRTKGVREPLVITDFTYGPTIFDVNTNRDFFADFSGGYEPYYQQYTFEHLASGTVKVEKFRVVDKVMHYFDRAGDYKITAEIKDQSGDVVSLSKVITITDIPFEFSELTATGENGGNLFVGKEVNFCARTCFEHIEYMKNSYDVVIKDSSGKIWYQESIKPTEGSTSYGYSIAYFNWTPERKGDYTVKISETDYKGEYAEKTTAFTVLDTFYGDANGDGEVNIKDATAIQKCLAGITQDLVFMAEFADCDTNEVLTIKDATCIRKYLANVQGAGKAGQTIGYIPPVTEPDPTVPTQPQTEPEPVGKNIVTFTNSFNWGGTISCYYWSDSNKSMTTWPGKAMTKSGTNEFGETLYTFDVPSGATYIIFTNGSSQTVDIPYSGGALKFYPVSETDGQGHYKVKNW